MGFRNSKALVVRAAKKKAGCANPISSGEFLEKLSNYWARLGLRKYVQP